MKTFFLGGAMLLAVLNGRAADLNLCLETRALVNRLTVEQGKALTAKIFLEAGIPVKWGGRTICEKDAGAIFVEIDADGPGRFQPDVMAYAAPYGQLGARIHVFYDRIATSHRGSLTATVLGHVMAHEIGHVLEGVARHSGSGLMKANWNSNDYYAMHGRMLAFAPEDVELLHAGVGIRMARTAASER